MDSIPLGLLILLCRNGTVEHGIEHRGVRHRRGRRGRLPCAAVGAAADGHRDGHSLGGSVWSNSPTGPV